MTDAALLDRAFETVRRRDFLPAEQHGFAREDTALPIGHGQTNSQPSTVRAMLGLLDVRPGDRVLDVGCGSGWTTALLGEMVGPRGEVVGVEIVPELVAWARENLAGYALSQARVEQALEDRLGWPAGAPYDRVLVSAEATALPTGLVGQVGEGGVLVVPVQGRMTVVRRTEDGPRVSEAGWYSFVPLHEPPAP
jgi:protein-L-isoaspartate(D-aspartate) O-methyltransferase